MELVTAEEFIARTLGGRPNQMDVTPYIGHTFACACGAHHSFEPHAVKVLRELAGARLVLVCSEGDSVTCVKVTGIFRFKGFESIFGNRSTKSEMNVQAAGSRQPYQDLVVGAINLAMTIKLKENKDFENFPINHLEAVIAIFWMVERSLRGLSCPKLEKAGSFAMDELLEWLSEEYSRDEMSRLVIPAFKKRLDEYSGLFVIKAEEEPQTPLLRTFKHIVENVFGEDEAHIARIMAAMLMWWQPISKEGARITTLDKNGYVSW